MPKRKKPDFSLPTQALWIKPDAIPADQKQFLRGYLTGSPFSCDESNNQRELFLRFATFLAQEPHDGDEPLQKQHDQLEKLAASASRLLQSVKGLNMPCTEGMSVFAREVAYDPTLLIDHDIAEKLRSRDGFSSFLGQLWDQVEAVEVIAERTRGNLQLAKTSHPKKDRTRAVVSRLAHYHWQLTGEWPSSGPSGWFGEFAAKLGETMGLEVGPTVLKTGIAEAINEGDSVDRLKLLINDASP